MKFTIEYKRTVRVREYETLTIGISSDFNKGEKAYSEAFKICKSFVNTHILAELAQLRQEERS